MLSYLVAGASRGIGLELVRQLSSLQTTSHVFAGARNPSGIPAELTTGATVIPIKLDVTSSEDISEAAQTISETTSSTLDVLIINAGINVADTVTQASVSQLVETLDTNTVGVHRIIQSFLPLLRAGKTKKIIVLGAASGTFPVAHHLAMGGLPAAGAYAVSKAATHMLTMLYAAELGSEGFLIASIHPGIVMTDMAADAMQRFPGMESAMGANGMKIISTVESVQGMVKVIDALTVADSGKLLSWEGEVLPF